MMSGSVRRLLGLRCYSKSKCHSPKPPLIPFQPKLSNAVNLIGQIVAPLQSETSPDGNAWAATVITRQDSPSSPYLSIPVIFEGDLAHTATSHLKPNDFIHVEGQLTTDPPRFQQHHPLLLSNMQLIVQTLNFVQPPNNTTFPKTLPIPKSEEHATKPSRRNIRAKQNEEPDLLQSWKDLLDSPIEWWDLRSAKENPEGAAFERKTNGELLFLDSSTSKWLQEKLESMTFDLKPEPKQSLTAAKKDQDSLLNSWTDLVENPGQWCDFRERKHNGLVKPKYPDFKRKDGSVSLWLNQAPSWFLPKLKGLEFYAPDDKSKQAKGSKGDLSWNDLVQNPAKWWDNRLHKRNVKAPDFKHKETGEALWLNDSPSWVLAKLPPLKTKPSAQTGSKQTLVS
ncbi:hypothetical protein RJT34_29595 [Clitoria ternatea]|uniref:Uncharacterized protein n=1 Tax=Clitoria ternatea TaxID=43366 RepID=A0AAN9FA49_CLITE